MVIIILLVGILGAFVFSTVFNEDKENQNRPVVLTNTEGSENSGTTGASWHKVNTFNGDSDDTISITTKGSKFKVVSTAMPIKNYDANYLYTLVIDSNYNT